MWIGNWIRRLECSKYLVLWLCLRSFEEDCLLYLSLSFGCVLVELLVKLELRFLN